MKVTTKEIIIETLEKTIEEKGLHIQSMLFTSERITKIKEERKAEKITKSVMEEAIEECEFCRAMDRLKLDSLNTKIETLKVLLLTRPARVDSLFRNSIKEIK